MTEAEAIEVARSYAAEYDVPWVGMPTVTPKWTSWFFQVLEYHLDLDTGGQGAAKAAVNADIGVFWFEFRPLDPGRFWLPPWAAYPTYHACTMGWRMGGGEDYWLDWHKWYAALLDHQKEVYQERFPEPDRDGWPGFYELTSLRH